ncbi:MAG: M48 family metallopeptidase [Colwellia sp.]|uniref:M48 family metallopeptidase n=1 Tax=Colwellia sp. TaxID=56799 RepID=UPI001DDDE997|nr:SprT family zinc-dependent metalloprotease [Colwellia sp.]NQY49085.1 M48 family metallopeptidase [Colwellia sp.]
MLEYQLIRSKRRKTLSLQVKHGRVTVRAPHYVKSAFIDTFIQEKSAWLQAKLIEQQSIAKFCDFSQGASLLFLGEQVSLNIGTAKQARVFFAEKLVTNTDLSRIQQPAPRQLNVVISNRVSTKLASDLAITKQVKKQLEGYFKQQAEKLIIERLEVISEQTSLTPTKVNIRQYRARWGSCNNRGEVSFNYFLMMTPLFVIDYVIIHELCHLEFLNHSKSFWQLVKQHSPNYQKAKQWLSHHQSQLYWLNPS